MRKTCLNMSEVKINMEKYFVIIVLLHLVYLTSSIYNKEIPAAPTSEPFFRKDYRWYPVAQSFYKFHTTHRTWLDAKRRCVLEGAMLWYPENQAELDAMVDYWKQKRPLETKLFVGATDLASEGLWETIDGKLVEDWWDKWGPGEPNNGGSSGTAENCAVVRRDAVTPGGTNLSDENCYNQHPFICKKPRATINWNILCDIPDQSYIYEASLGKCYKLHRKPRSWPEAHSVCVAEQSYLSVINSVKEKDFLVKMAADAKVTDIPGGHYKLLLMGFHKFYGEWMTVTGEPLEDSGYLVWEKNQPDGAATNEVCGSAFMWGTYNDLWCDKTAFFICEHDIGLLSNAVDERLGE